MIDFSALDRNEIRYELSSIIGDAELSEEAREQLVTLVEHRSDITEDEFWKMVEQATTSEETDSMAEELSGMTVKELRSIAKEIAKANNGVEIRGYTTMRKAELVSLLTRTIDDVRYFTSLELERIERNAEEAELTEIKAEIEAEAAYIEEGVERDESATDPELTAVIINRTGGKSAHGTLYDGTRERYGSIKREGRFWVLRDLTDGKLTQVKATTLIKLAKQWACSVDVWAEDIQVYR